MDVAHVGLVHRDPCECKIKGFRAVSSIERNVSNRRHLQGVRQEGRGRVGVDASKRTKFYLMKQLVMQGNVPSVVSLSTVPPVGSNDVGASNIMAELATVDGGTTSNMPPPERGPCFPPSSIHCADSAKGGGGVLQVEDRLAPSIPVIESQEDSLQFRFEVEMEDVK